MKRFGATPARFPAHRVIAWLTEHGYRPERARPLPGHAAWGAPDEWEAACPLCAPDERSLRVEAWGNGVITVCVNTACASWTDATKEQHVHDRVWRALIERGITDNPWRKQ